MVSHDIIKLEKMRIVYLQNLIRLSRQRLKNFRWGTFSNAESLCRNFGAHLTSIHSADENHFVAELAETGLEFPSNEAHERATWIGLRRADDSKGDWLWTDGTKVDFLAWSPNEPNDSSGNERCVEVHFISYTSKLKVNASNVFRSENCMPNLRSSCNVRIAGI
ncbi:unnamed protein product [Cylicostephanus goldi]|uniref:C-type lectin domain-containing protein n=1 Tax=Cylicostephanus goldi TaxID=71465 RepID=A0A3P6SJK7_CYLGO|nr:unnamed protein product [Cylicostephanus goldi]